MISEIARRHAQRIAEREYEIYKAKLERAAREYEAMQRRVFQPPANPHEMEGTQDEP